ncbi:MAG TPA: NADH-quinone oxidoreductase subunit G [Candidatus Nanopelagicaceae bacterium]|nr:NADH-quinone oxidoreductase subunit G [Candidatus Nanopelagicaceae bacterium]
MTITNNTETGVTPVEMVTAVIDGFEVSVPKGTLIIRAAESIGIQIPRFCDHPLLAPVGACRQCLVEVEINGRAFPKPQASCTMPVEPNMIVKTQLTSPVAEKAQRGNMEFLLINHPLDCPVCDKGGECPLQNQSMSSGDAVSRFDGTKRTFLKPINISSQVLLDRERCILCARCTRFSDQIAGDPFITLNERGALQQVGIYEKDPFESYFSGNTVQICPVGALTGASYRFRSRPFDLVSTSTVCEHCASGCAMRTDVRRSTVLRRLAGDDPAVNEEWNCDKGRWAFTYAAAQDRLTTPLVRDEITGELVKASWPEAIAIAAAGLSTGRAAVLVGGRSTLEDAYAYQKFARVALGTNDIDFRSRPISTEESAFLASTIVSSTVSNADIDSADTVLLISFEAEEESPIVFLRIRKQVKKRGLKVATIAPYLSRGAEKLEANLFHSIAAVDTQLTARSLILVGERATLTQGLLSRALELAKSTGAKIAWVPRRAGERGSLEAGAIGNLLPLGRPVVDAAARVDVAAAWGVASIPAEPGRDTDEILQGAKDGQIAALLVGAVDPFDLAEPSLALAALETAFVVSLELRESEVTRRANVVFPVASVTEKSGTFLNWEGRERNFDQVLAGATRLGDLRVLTMLAEALEAPLKLHDVAAAKTELNALGTWDGARAQSVSHEAGTQRAPEAGEAVLASWRMLLDAGSLQDGEANLAGTARRALARLSAKTAAEVGIQDGGLLLVTTDSGSISIPFEITDMPDRVVWLPENSTGSQIRRSLAVTSGAVVRIGGGA